MNIEYDASLEALICPGARATVLAAGAQPSLQALASEAARLAYVQAETSLADRARLDDALDRVGFGPASSMFDVRTGGYVYCSRKKTGGQVLVAFRGTEPHDLRDFMTDLQAQPAPWRGVRVHTGFLVAAQALEGPVQDWLARHREGGDALLLCGHSLGAALATLFALVVESAQVVTIGSPRVGNADFVAALQGIPITRIVDCCDVVATLPPALAAYRHAGQLLYIDKDGATHLDAEPDFMLKDQARGQAEFTWKNLVSANLAAVPVRALSDHSPINYVRALF
ncbi:triacylglycerol lipase [Variovorax sp. OV329]|nr:triacylglycerol lipase [Variovorax sp. OV329]